MATSVGVGAGASGTGNVQSVGSLPAGSGAFHPATVYSGNVGPGAQHVGPSQQVTQVRSYSLGPLSADQGTFLGDVLGGIYSAIGNGSSYQTGVNALAGAPVAAAKLITGQPLNPSDVAALQSSQRQGGGVSSNVVQALGQVAGGVGATVGNAIGVATGNSAKGVGAGVQAGVQGGTNLGASAVGGGVVGAVQGLGQGLGNALGTGGEVGGVPTLLWIALGAVVILVVVSK
jgi:hypothetical protein